METSGLTILLFFIIVFTLLASFILYLLISRCRTPASKRLKLWLKAQSDADQLVDTMAAQTRSIIDGLRPCRRRERVRKRRAQRQRHIRAHLQEDIDGNSSAGARVESEDDIITNEFWRRHQRQRQERSEIQDSSSMPSHGECVGEGEGGADRVRGKQSDEVAGEKLWEFVVGWCLIGSIFIGLALILGATFKAQDGVSPEVSWTIDVDDKDSLIDTVVAHILKIAFEIKDFGDQLMEQGIFIFIVGVNGYVLIRQRVFARRRLYEAELMQGDTFPKDGDRGETTDGQQRVGHSVPFDNTDIEKTGETGGDFYANIEIIQSSGFVPIEEPISIIPTPSSTLQSTTTHAREMNGNLKDQHEENDDSPEFGTMSFLAWFNYLQVGILVIEFLQLFSFPLRELMEFYNQTEKTSALYENAKSVLTILGAAASVGKNSSLINNAAYQSEISRNSLGNTSNLSQDVPATLLSNFTKFEAINLGQTVDFDWVKNRTSSWFRNITASAEWIKDNFPGLTNITEEFTNNSIPLNTQGDLEEMKNQIINAAIEISAQGWSAFGANNSTTSDGPPSNITSPPTAPKKMAGDSDIIMQVVNSLGLQPSINTHDWYLLRFWSCFAAVLLGWLVALCIHGWNRRCRRKRREGKSHWSAISVGWVSCFIPLVSVLYLPILSTFLSSAACQSQAIQAYAHERFTQKQEQSRLDNHNPHPSSIFDSIVVSLIDPASTVSPTASTLLCTGPQVQPSLYLAGSLIGYTLAYLLFMVFLTSFERSPNKGEICFQPNGVAVLKNLGLLLALDFLLIQSPSQRRFRGLVSMAIMLAMACYTIRMKPCYWDKINYWRTFSFSCVLYASLLVALLCPAPEPDRVKGDRIGGKWVMAPHLQMGHAWAIGGGPKVMLAWIASGWAILIVAFVLVDRVFLRHWKQKLKSQNDSASFRQEGGSRNGYSSRQDRHGKPEGETITSNFRSTRDGLHAVADPLRYQRFESTALETPPRGLVGSTESGSHWSIVDLACEDNININYS